MRRPQTTPVDKRLDRGLFPLKDSFHTPINSVFHPPGYVPLAGFIPGISTKENALYSTLNQNMGANVGHAFSFLPLPDKQFDPFLRFRFNVKTGALPEHFQMA